LKSFDSNGELTVFLMNARPAIVPCMSVVVAGSEDTDSDSRISLFEQGNKIWHFSGPDKK